MTAPAVTNSFASNTTAFASEVNTNFSDLVTYISNRNDASATWDRCNVTSSSAVPMTVNNSTGTSNIANFQDNGTNVFQIIDGGDIAINATAKLYLDGAGDTYIHESSANVVQVVTGGSARLQFDGTVGVQISGTNDFAVPATQKIYFDGGNNTYVQEEAGDDLIVVTAGAKCYEWSGANNVVGAQSALATNATDGFLYIPTSAGAPSGNPTAFAGKVALEYDITNNTLNIFNGAWKSVTLS